MSQTTQPDSRIRDVLLAALAAAGVTLATTLFSTNQRDLTFTLSPWETFATALTLAAIPTLIYFVVLAVFGLFRWLRNWWRALIVGIIGVLLGGALGYLLQIVSNDVPLDGTAWAAIFGEFLGLNFPFAVAGMLSATFVAPAVLRARSGAASQIIERPAGALLAPTSTTEPGSAFLRIPSDPLLAQLGERADAANEQWEALVAAFEEHGWGTQAVSGGEDEPTSVLLGDAALVLGEQVIMARRGGAEDAAAQQLREVLETAGAVFDQLEAPAEFHPADVVEAPGTLYVGTGDTTNAAALRALRRLVRPRGYRVVGVLTAPGIHLADAMSVLPNGNRLIWREAILNPEVLGEVLLAPEPRGAAVVALDADTIAVAQDAAGTAELLAELGYVVVEVDISAFSKIGGSLPRLSLRSRD